MRRLLVVLFYVLFFSMSFFHSAIADDRVNPIEGTIDSGSDYPLLSNKTPGMVIVITYQQIRSRGYRSVFEVLRDLPGFTSRGGFGQSKMFISIDGEQSQNNEKFLLFVDGVLEQDLWRRSVWLGFQYSLRFVKNVTVFYGPAAARFGANAMSGVVFLDTKKAEDLGDKYGELSVTKDIRNNMFSLDFMIGHSYNRRRSPKLARNLVSWYLRGRFYYSNERSAKNSQLWDVNNKSGYLGSFFENKAQAYRLDYKRAFPQKKEGEVESAVSNYRKRLIDEFVNDRSNSGQYANPMYENKNLTFNAEAGFRIDNWFARFFVWSTSTGPGMRYLPSSYQASTSWSLRNLSVSLHSLRSELWSSGVGEKARVVYFDFNLIYQRHEVPSSSYKVLFASKRKLFAGQKCPNPIGEKKLDCTWTNYSWKPIYSYIVSSSFRAQPKLDFRLLEGRLKFSVGFDAGLSYLQGAAISSKYPEPELNPGFRDGKETTDQFEHTFFTAFLQSEIRFSKNLVASLGLRSDWEAVRGRLEVVPNCERAFSPCYRFSAPLVGRASLVAKLGKVDARLSYGYAFLSPSNWQLYSAEIGQLLDAREQLPQDKHSIELNIFASISERFFVTASIFHNWLSNVDGIVFLPFLKNQSRHVNIGNQRTLGSRFYIISKLSSLAQLNINFAVLYPQLDVFGVAKSDPNATIHLTDIPVFQANLILDLTSSPDPEESHFFGSLRFNFQTSRRNTGYDQQENGTIEVVPGVEVGPIVGLHLSAGYIWLPENAGFFKNLSISLTGENILAMDNRDLGIYSARALGNHFPNPAHSQINAFLQASVGF